MQKHWISSALSFLSQSLEPVPHELNEIDWKAGLSASKERLTEHLIAFANLSQGGFLAFGIRNADAHLEGIDRAAAEKIVNTLVNLGRDAIEPPIALDHLLSKTLTNTSLRERFKLHDKQRTQVSNLIRDAVDAGRIKRKDATTATSSKFAEYLPYWA
jgi:predicted HTH transcriptional regulator